MQLDKCLVQSKLEKLRSNSTLQQNSSSERSSRWTVFLMRAQRG